jgi:hypothetical protein
MEAQAIKTLKNLEAEDAKLKILEIDSMLDQVAIIAALNAEYWPLSPSVRHCLGYKKRQPSPSVASADFRGYYVLHYAVDQRSRRLAKPYKPVHRW